MILKFFRIFSILLIIILFFFYIYQVNAEVSERYLVQDYNKKIKELSRENGDLEIQAARLNSLDKIAELVKPFNFEKTKKIHYIKVLETQVVAK